MRHRDPFARCMISGPNVSCPAGPRNDAGAGHGSQHGDEDDGDGKPSGTAAGTAANDGQASATAKIERLRAAERQRSHTSTTRGFRTIPAPVSAARDFPSLAAEHRGGLPGGQGGRRMKRARRPLRRRSTPTEGRNTNRRLEPIEFGLASQRRSGAATFPECRIHGTRIVDGFPPGCPLACIDVHAALCALRDKAWSECASRSGGAGALFRRYGACVGCAPDLLGHSRIVELRLARRGHDD